VAIEVERIARDRLGEWQAYVDASACAQAMHHSAWYDVLGDAFPVRRSFLMARRAGGAVCGVLPMYLSNGPFFGRHLTSLEDGMLADDVDTRDALLQEALEERDRARARYALIRGVPAADRLPVAPLFIRPTIRRTVDTSRPIEETYAALDRRVRRELRRAEESGYAVMRDEPLATLDTEFYDAYAAHVHRLGTPVMSRALMSAMKHRLGPGRLRLYLVAKTGSRAAGGILGVVSSAGFSGLYGMVRPDDKHEFATYLLYWRIIEDLTRAGIATFDLGRSAPHSGSYGFKKKWPGADRELGHAYFGTHGAGMSAETAARENGGAKERIWQALPLGLANRIGPSIRAQLPFG
jgi:hypothetical protein